MLPYTVGKSCAQCGRDFVGDTCDKLCMQCVEDNLISGKTQCTPLTNCCIHVYARTIKVGKYKGQQTPVLPIVAKCKTCDGRLLCANCVWPAHGSLKHDVIELGEPNS